MACSTGGRPLGGGRETRSLGSLVSWRVSRRVGFPSALSAGKATSGRGLVSIAGPPSTVALASAAPSPPSMPPSMLGGM
jgi:hypothetical protein